MENNGGISSETQNAIEDSRSEAILYSSSSTRSIELGRMIANIGANVRIVSDLEEAKTTIEEVGHNLLIADVSGFDPNGINLLNWFNLNSHKHKIQSLGIITSAATLIPKFTYRINFDNKFTSGDTTFDNLTTALFSLYASNKPIEWLRLATNAYHEGRNKLKAVESKPKVALLIGEIGVGKDAFAQIAHETGERKNHKFVHVDCRLEGNTGFLKIANAKERTEIERNIQSLMAEADGGTLYFHEVPLLPIEVQKILADVLRKNVYHVPGTSKVKKFSGLTIVSAHGALSQEIIEGRFTGVLYDVVSPITVRIPSLSECKSDIVLLAEAFLDLFCARESLPAMELSIRAKNILLEHIWTGNVRELYSVITRAAMNSDGKKIQTSDIDLLDVSDDSEKPINKRAIVRKALRDAKGNKAKAARILNTTRTTLYRWLEELNIPKDYPKGESSTK